MRRHRDGREFCRGWLLLRGARGCCRRTRRGSSHSHLLFEHTARAVVCHARRPSSERLVATSALEFRRLRRPRPLARRLGAAKRDAAAGYLPFLLRTAPSFSRATRSWESSPSRWCARCVETLPEPTPYAAQERELLGGCFRSSTRPTSSSAPVLRTRDATYPRATAHWVGCDLFNGSATNGSLDCPQFACAAAPILACSRGTYAFADGLLDGYFRNS